MPSVEGARPWINHLKTLEVCRCDQVWVGDVPYVRLKGHFVYVALLMDVFTRRIRGWKLSQQLTQSLTLTPLQEALRQSVPEIHHSDQGVQYLSNAYISTLQCHNIEISVAQRGCPWENGYAERLIGTLKVEEVHLNAYQDIHEARERIGHFIWVSLVKCLTIWTDSRHIVTVKSIIGRGSLLREHACVLCKHTSVGNSKGISSLYWRGYQLTPGRWRRGPVKSALA